jgi:hypothetical protein
LKIQNAKFKSMIRQDFLNFEFIILN